MNVCDIFDDYYKKQRYKYGVFPYTMEIEQGKDQAIRLIKHYQSKSNNNKINRQDIGQINLELQLKTGCTERDSQYYTVLALGKKAGAKVAKSLKWEGVTRTAELTHDYLTHLYTESFHWQKRTGQGVRDTRLPKGLFGFIGEEYRVSENGVVQSNKGDEYWSNMTGTVGQSHNKIHFSNIEGIDHLFLTREEIVAAFFMDDVANESLYLHVKDPSKGVTVSNLEFKKSKTNSKGRSRSVIYKETGYLIQKVKGKELNIKEIKESVTRKKTDSWLRSLKNEHRTTATNYFIARVEGGYHLLTKQKYDNLPKQTRKEMVLHIKDIANKEGRLTLNQAKFHALVNQAINK